MIFSLIAMTIAFTGLLIWVYRPSQRAHFEAQAMLVFERDQFRHGKGSSDLLELPVRYMDVPPFFMRETQGECEECVALRPDQFAGSELIRITKGNGKGNGRVDR